MKYIYSIHRIGSFLPVLLAAIFIVGCADDYPTPVSPGEKGTITQFTLTVPDITIPSVSTRTMAGATNKEDEVQSIDILIFDASNTTEVFLERVVVNASDITHDFSSNPSKVTFSAKLTATTTETRIVLVANEPVTMNLEKGVTTKLEVMQGLIRTSTDKWPADGANTGGYRAIPMYGETSKIDKITPSVSIPAINLTRMLARIDIINSASGFLLEEVYLVNYNTTGYVAPAWDADGQLINDTSDPINVPGDGGKQTGVESNERISYVITNGVKDYRYEGEIYTYEAPAAIDAANNSDGSPNDDSTDRKDAVCLIVKGKIDNGTSSYYRIDFLTGEKDEAVYMALKRNYKYIIDITDASGTGYPSPEEALAAYRTMTNMSVRLIAYNRDKVSDIVYNGQYMLGVSESEINVSQYEHTEYKIDVFTDNPEGWEATILSTPGSDWLKFSDGTQDGNTNPVTGNANVDGEVLLKIPYYRADVDSERTATVVLTAGRLTQEIKITQKVGEPGMIKFVDAYGNVLENGLFFPMNNSNNDLVAQTIYAIWTSANIKVSRDRTTDATSTTRPIQYATIMPGIPNPPASGSTTEGELYPLQNGVQAITLLPTAGNDSWRQEVLKFRLYDEAGVQLGNEVKCPINQANLIFQITNYSADGANNYPMDLGAPRYLDLSTNVNWEIEKIEEIGATGLYDVNKAGWWDDGDNDGDIGWTQRPGGLVKTGLKNPIPIVASTPSFRLWFPAGDWSQGKNGTVRITFKCTMQVGSGELFPFYRTIDLEMTSQKRLSYTDGALPYFYTYSIRNENYNKSSTSMSLTSAQDKCIAIGGQWRMPAFDELLLSYVYHEAIGGVDNTLGWYSGANYWSSSLTGGVYAGLLFDNFGNITKFSDPSGYAANVRCVYPETSSETKYPNLKTYASGGDTGILITSRENNIGVNSSVLSTTTPTDDKVPEKLLVAYENSSYLEDYVEEGEGNWVGYNAWTKANLKCKEKGTDWRLPTLREALLIWGLGGVNTSVAELGVVNQNWPPPYTKVDEALWTMTEKDGKPYMIHPVDFYMSEVPKTQGGLDGWVRARCVKSIP